MDLSLERINVVFSKSSPLEKVVLRDLTLRVRDGEFVAVLGSNGSGKSTMFNVIAGNIIPDNGSLLVGGKDCTKVPMHKRAGFIVKVAQDPKMGTMPGMSVMENMAFAYKRGKVRGLLPYCNASRQLIFKEKLALLSMNLENRLFEPVANLSGGQRQSLSLAMALLQKSSILLLDEMTASLDYGTAEKVMQIISKVVRLEGVTTLMITHNLQHAIKYADRIVVLVDGSIRKEFLVCDDRSLEVSVLAKELY